MNDVELTLAAQINALSFGVRIHAKGVCFCMYVAHYQDGNPSKIPLFPLDNASNRTASVFICPAAADARWSDVFFVSSLNNLHALLFVYCGLLHKNKVS